MSVESGIQHAIVDRLKAQIAKIEVYAQTDNFESSGLPWSEAVVTVGHPGSRSTLLTNSPYEESEDLLYLVSTELKDLTDERAAIDLISSIKAAIRGFTPIRPTSRILKPLSVLRSDNVQQKDGYWKRTVTATIALRRTVTEEWAFPNSESSDIALPANIRIEAGIWRKEIGTEVRILDGEIDLNYEGL